MNNTINCGDVLMCWQLRFIENRPQGVKLFTHIIPADLHIEFEEVFYPHFTCEEVRIQEFK